MVKLADLPRRPARAGGVSCQDAVGRIDGRGERASYEPRAGGDMSIERVLLVLAVALFAALSAAPAVAVPPEPPLATSSNVEVIDHIPGTAAGMNFKDHYAFVSGWTGVTVLDIAKPASPQIVGELPLPHFENEDVDLCGNTLIVVNDREAKDLGSVMYVVSIADPAA